MSDRTTSVEPGASTDRADPQTELDRRQEEILRLRDLLIGKDAELGAAKGRLAELEAQSQRLASAVRRLQSRLPGLMRLTGAGLRGLEGRRGRSGE